MSQKILKEENFYTTTSVALAATILTFYPPEIFEAIDKRNSHKTFIFKRWEGLDKLIENFWRSDLKIEPQVYFNLCELLNGLERKYE